MPDVNPRFACDDVHTPPDEWTFFHGPDCDDCTMAACYHLSLVGDKRTPSFLLAALAHQGIGGAR